MKLLLKKRQNTHERQEAPETQVVHLLLNYPTVLLPVHFSHLPLLDSVFCSRTPVAEDPCLTRGHSICQKLRQLTCLRIVQSCSMTAHLITNSPLNSLHHRLATNFGRGALLGQWTQNPSTLKPSPISQCPFPYTQLPMSSSLICPSPRIGRDSKLLEHRPYQLP